MGYNIIDLLDKFVVIEQNGYRFFMEMAEEMGQSEKFRTLARVFAKEEQRHVEVYKALMRNMEKEAEIEVDFLLYDKASKLVNDFIKFEKQDGGDTPRKLLEFCLNFEKENLALVVHIRGILIRAQKDGDSPIYKALSKIIEEEQSHVKNIEYFLNS